MSATSSDELRILGLGMLGDLSAMLGEPGKPLRQVEHAKCKCGTNVSRKEGWLLWTEVSRSLIDVSVEVSW